MQGLISLLQHDQHQHCQLSTPDTPVKHNLNIMENHFEFHKKNFAKLCDSMTRIVTS